MNRRGFLAKAVGLVGAAVAGPAVARLLPTPVAPFVKGKRGVAGQMAARVFDPGHAVWTKSYHHKTYRLGIPVKEAPGSSWDIMEAYCREAGAALRRRQEEIILGI
jgi:hypothetical protein